jgi:hypothetical protein
MLMIDACVISVVVKHFIYVSSAGFSRKRMYDVIEDNKDSKYTVTTFTFNITEQLFYFILFY